jgi:pimeloyl-ACP methyl ester carboxylesterase
MRAIRKSLSGDSEAPAVLVVTFRLRKHRFGLGPTFSRREHCTIPGHLAHGFIADGWVARLCNTAHGSRQNPTEVAGLTEEQVLAIAEHEHLPEIAAAALAQYLLKREHGMEKVRDMPAPPAEDRSWARCLRKSERHKPGAKLSVYQGIGHSPFFEEPSRFNAELAGFVRSAQK